MVKVEANVNLNIPKKADKNLSKAVLKVAEGISSVLTLPEKTLNLLQNSGATLFSALSGYLDGSTKVKKAKNFAEAEQIRREVSQIKLAYNVLCTLKEKEINGEELPPKIEDTDTLFSIQNAASETTDEDFIKFWARLYTEEACKPNTVSKKTVNLCKDLNKDVVKALENEIFPFCDGHGYYFGDANCHVDALSLVEDYGFLKTCKIKNISNYIDTFSSHKFGKYLIQVFPGYEYGLPFNHRMLTQSALEIFKCLKIDNSINLWECIPQIEDASKSFKITDKYKDLMKYKTPISHKFFITLDDKIIYPEDMKKKNLADVIKETLDNIEFSDEASVFRTPISSYLTVLINESSQNAE